MVVVPPHTHFVRGGEGAAELLLAPGGWGGTHTQSSCPPPPSLGLAQGSHLSYTGRWASQLLSQVRERAFVLRPF